MNARQKCKQLKKYIQLNSIYDKGVRMNSEVCGGLKNSYSELKLKGFSVRFPGFMYEENGNRYLPEIPKEKLEAAKKEICDHLVEEAMNYIKLEKYGYEQSLTLYVWFEENAYRKEKTERLRRSDK